MSNLNISHDNRNKVRESFETFGQKSLLGVINTIKSDSRNSKNDCSSESEKNYGTLKAEQLPIQFSEQQQKNENISHTLEEDKTQTTTKRQIETDDSTDISAQVTKRTNHTKSSCSIPNPIGNDQLIKVRPDSKLSKESEEIGIQEDTQKSKNSQVYDYTQFMNKQFEIDMNQSDQSNKSLNMEDNVIEHMIENVRYIFLIRIGST